MAELIINSAGTYDGNWEIYEYIEVNASPVTLKHFIISKEGYYILLSWSGGGQLTINECIFSGWWGINNSGGGNLTVRNCDFNTMWGINTSDGHLTLVNNLFRGACDFWINSQGDTIIAINNTFAGHHGHVFNIWSDNLTLKNNIFSHNYGAIINSWDSSFSIRTNLKSGNSAWYSDQYVPPGNLIQADPGFIVQNPGRESEFKHYPYPNGYFLATGSPAINTGENEPGNPPYGCLGTTSIQDIPDNIELSNTIDLGFHYPLWKWQEIIIEENVNMFESGNYLTPPTSVFNDLVLIKDKVIPSYIKISVTPLLFGPLRDLWIGSKS